MVIEILKKLKLAKNPTSADIAAAASQIDLAALEKAIQDATANHRRTLLSGASEAEVAKAENELDAGNRALQRGRIVADDLAVRYAEALDREAVEALDRKRSETEAEAQTAADLLRRRWPKLQAEMVELLERIERADVAILTTNELLAKAGRTDVLDGVEWRVRPRPAMQHESVVSISNNVRLPEIDEWSVAGYGPTLQVADAFWSETPRAPNDR